MQSWDLSPHFLPQQAAKAQAESASTQKAEREVTRMVVLMVMGFLVCWMPYASFALWVVNNRGQTFDLRFASIPSVFSKSSAVYNPVIYVLLNKQVSWMQRHVETHYRCVQKKKLILKCTCLSVPIMHDEDAGDGRRWWWRVVDIVSDWSFQSWTCLDWTSRPSTSLPLMIVDCK